MARSTPRFRIPKALVVSFVVLPGLSGCPSNPIVADELRSDATDERFDVAADTTVVADVTPDAPDALACADLCRMFDPTTCSASCPSPLPDAGTGNACGTTGCEPYSSGSTTCCCCLVV